MFSSTAEILYKTSDYCHPKMKFTWIGFDLDVGINWPISDSVDYILSAKNALGLSLNLLASEAKK